MPVSQTSPAYALGFQHGLELAQSGVVPPVLAPAPPRKEQWALATGTLLTGLGAAGILVARSAAPRTSEAFVLITVSGLLITSLVAAIRVLDGGPTPGLQLT